MGRRRRIRTVLYGDQEIETTELDLLHTPALQRLYDLHQLGLADRVFIDASHSRLHHVIGVMQQVDNILTAISENLSARRGKPIEVRRADGAIAKFSRKELANYSMLRRRAARLMGLLHDLTHGPYGHTLEDEIELSPQKHDSPARQADAFYRLLVQYVGWVAEDAGLFSRAEVDHANVNAVLLARAMQMQAVDALPQQAGFVEFVASIGGKLLSEPAESRKLLRAPGRVDMERLFRDLAFAMRALLWLDALHKDQLDGYAGRNDNIREILPTGAYPFEHLLDRILSAGGCEAIAPGDRFWLQRDAFLLDVIGNTICADLLDYAKRDSHHAGLRLDYDVDRIVENFTLVSYRDPRHHEDRSKVGFRKLDPLIRTGIAIFSHKLRVDVPGELFNLLQVRFFVYQRVLYHPTKCVAGAMLGSALQLIGWKVLPTHFRFVGDAVFLHEVAAVARFTRGVIAKRTQIGGGAATEQVLVLREDPAVTAQPDGTFRDAVNGLIDARGTELLADLDRGLAGAIQLLDRLAARRFHRPVFRLLPNASVPELNMDATHIAEVFLDAERRLSVERKVETLLNMPTGSVTIHCPSGDGPRKIAEILIVSDRDGRESAFPLRKIGQVDRDIFEKHQHAIVALEDMYRSMWRLTVSVAPPYLPRHAAIAKTAGRVLFCILKGVGYEEQYNARTEPDLNGDLEIPAVPNDPRMTRELEVASADNVTDDALEQVEILYSDGRREERTLPYLEIADLAVERVRRARPAVDGYLRTGRFAADEPQEVTLRSEMDAAIPIVTNPAVPATPADVDRETASTRDAVQTELLSQPPRRPKRER
jgi:HD superfamily phosphohydrolase